MILILKIKLTLNTILNSVQTTVLRFTVDHLKVRNETTIVVVLIQHKNSLTIEHVG